VNLTGESLRRVLALRGGSDHNIVVIVRRENFVKKQAPAPAGSQRLPRKRPGPGEAERIPASEFKARCLDLLNRVRDERRSIVVTKHGKPVARVVPFEDEPPSIVGFLRDTVVYYGDIVSPIDDPWEADEP